MGRLVRIPNSIWIRMTKEQQEQYYKQQRKADTLAGIIVGITLILSFTILLLWGLK